MVWGGGIVLDEEKILGGRLVANSLLRRALESGVVLGEGKLGAAYFGTRSSCINKDCWVCVSCLCMIIHLQNIYMVFCYSYI